MKTVPGPEAELEREELLHGNEPECLNVCVLGAREGWRLFWVPSNTENGPTGFQW